MLGVLRASLRGGGRRHLQPFPSSFLVEQFSADSHAHGHQSTAQEPSSSSEQEKRHDGSGGEKSKDEHTRVLQAALPYVVKLGWSEAAMISGARDVGLSPSIVGSFQRKEAALVEYFMDECLEKLIERIQSEKELSNLIISERIAKLIHIRLEMQAPYISKWPQALSIQYFMDECLEKLIERIQSEKELSNLIISERIAKLIHIRLEMQAPYISKWPQALSIQYFMDECLEKLIERIQSEKELSNLIISERIAKLIHIRLEMQAPYISKWPQALSIQAQPMNIPTSFKQRAVLVDEIWHAAGDEDSDIDWYVKRAALGGVYSTTELYMLTDHSPDFRDTWGFLEARVKDSLDLRKSVQEVAYLAEAVGAGIGNSFQGFMKKVINQ